MTGYAEIRERSPSCETALRRVQHVFEQTPGMIALLSGPDHVYEFVNRAYVDRFGPGPFVGRRVREVLPYLVDQGFLEIADQVLRTGEPFVGAGVKVLLPSGSGGPFEPRYYDFIYQPVIENGVVSGIFFQGQDATDRELAAERQRQLVHELEHRVKNTLATVIAITAQTVRKIASPADLPAALEGRLLALSSAHDAVLRCHGDSAEVAEILRQELAPYDASRFRLSGPPVTLSARFAVTLGMIVHELATNAAKYGALSTPDGRVEVRLTVDSGLGEPALLEWKESGGPVVQPPSRRGYGFDLIQRAFARTGPRSALEFRPDGVLCRIELPARAMAVQPLGAANCNAVRTTGDRTGK